MDSGRNAFLTGCSAPQEAPPAVHSDVSLPFALPEGIFYQDIIYWKSDRLAVTVNGQEVGTVENSVSCGELNKY